MTSNLALFRLVSGGMATAASCNGNISWKKSNIVIIFLQGCHGVGRKNSLTFPWLPTQIPVTIAIYTLWWFLPYILNHIEITLFINRCFNIVVLKIGQHKRMFSTSWKLLISCAEPYGNMKTNRVQNKNHLMNDIWMRTLFKILS